MSTLLLLALAVPSITSAVFVSGTSVTQTTSETETDLLFNGLEITVLSRFRYSQPFNQPTGISSYAANDKRSQATGTHGGYIYITEPTAVLRYSETTPSTDTSVWAGQFGTAATGYDPSPSLTGGTFKSLQGLHSRDGVTFYATEKTPEAIVWKLETATGMNLIAGGYGSASHVDNADGTLARFTDPGHLLDTSQGPTLSTGCVHVADDTTIRCIALGSPNKAVGTVLGVAGASVDIDGTAASTARTQSIRAMAWDNNPSLTQNTIFFVSLCCVIRKWDLTGSDLVSTVLGVTHGKHVGSRLIPFPVGDYYVGWTTTLLYSPLDIADPTGTPKNYLYSIDHQHNLLTRIDLDAGMAQDIAGRGIGFPLKPDWGSAPQVELYLASSMAFSSNGRDIIFTDLADLGSVKRIGRYRTSTETATGSATWTASETATLVPSESLRSPHSSLQVSTTIPTKTLSEPPAVPVAPTSSGSGVSTTTSSSSTTSNNNNNNSDPGGTGLGTGTTLSGGAGGGTSGARSSSSTTSSKANNDDGNLAGINIDTANANGNNEDASFPWWMVALICCGGLLLIGGVGAAVIWKFKTSEQERRERELISKIPKTVIAEKVADNVNGENHGGPGNTAKKKYEAPDEEIVEISDV